MIYEFDWKEQRTERYEQRAESMGKKVNKSASQYVLKVTLNPQAKSGARI
jgi:hypothetical protein